MTTAELAVAVGGACRITEEHLPWVEGKVMARMLAYHSTGAVPW